MFFTEKHTQIILGFNVIMPPRKNLIVSTSKFPARCVRISASALQFKYRYIFTHFYINICAKSSHVLRNPIMFSDLPLQFIYLNIVYNESTLLLSFRSAGHPARYTLSFAKVSKCNGFRTGSAFVLFEDWPESFVCISLSTNRNLK